VTLIERYLGEVGRRIPHRQRADVIRELRSSLLDAVDSRFGPEASEEDVVTLLRELGPPEAVAASYQPSSQYLIGPAWYPTFRLVVRIHVLSLIWVLAIGGGLVLAFTPPDLLPGRLGDVVAGVVRYGLLGLGAITLVFSLLEQAGVRSPRPHETWDPRDLPTAEAEDLVGRGEAGFTVVITALALVLLHQSSGYIGLWIGEGPPLLNNVMRDNLPWLTVLGGLLMLLYAVLAWEGHWRWYTRAAQVGLDLLFLVIVYRVASGVAAEQDALLAAGLPPAGVTAIVQSAIVTGLIAAACALYDVAKTLLRARRSSLRRDGGSGRRHLTQAPRLSREGE
jgi:hypothetical protein